MIHLLVGSLQYLRGALAEAFESLRLTLACSKWSLALKQRVIENVGSFMHPCDRVSPAVLVLFFNLGHHSSGWAVDPEALFKFTLLTVIISDVGA